MDVINIDDSLEVDSFSITNMRTNVIKQLTDVVIGYSISLHLLVIIIICRADILFFIIIAYIL